MLARLDRFQSVPHGSWRGSGGRGTPGRWARMMVSWMVAAALVTAPLGARVQAQPAVPTVTIQECEKLTGPDVRRHIHDLTESALNSEMAQMNYAALVDKHWRETGMSARLDTEVDEAIRAVRADTGVIDRAYSTVSRETAEKTAIAVAERTFGSEGFKSSLAVLAQGIGKDFGSRIEEAAGKVAEPVVTCVRASLQTRYGSAVAQVFTKEAQENLEVSPQAGGARIGAGDLVVQGAGAVSGIVLVVSRRIVAQMVATIGRRVAGLVASRVIASFTGLAGLALIVNDLYQAADGVFPLISERMKSDEAKTLIKEELTKSIETDLRQQVSAIAGETADRIYSSWLDFKQKYSTLLNLAEKSETFAAFLKDRKIDQLGRLGQITGLLLSQDGEAGVFRHMNDGSLGRALLDLDDAGVSIAVATKSLDTALAWSRLAGRKLPKVIEYGLPQVVDPAGLNDEQLAALLGFGDRGAVLRVASLDRGARDAILALPPQNLRDFVRRLTSRELEALATYQTRLDRTAANRLLRVAAENPAIMKSLAAPGLQGAILNSHDQQSAVNMLLRDNSALSITHITDDFALVRDGQVHYRVFAERYWVGLLVLAFFSLLVLLWLRRLFWSRPATVIIKTPDGSK